MYRVRLNKEHQGIPTKFDADLAAKEDSNRRHYLESFHNYIDYRAANWDEVQEIEQYLAREDAEINSRYAVIGRE